MNTYQGGCHCGAIRFEVEARAPLTVNDCNCSICSKAGFLHLIVPGERFRLLSGSDHLHTYTFNTGTAKHYFCQTCGIKAFYIPRSHPDGVSVNARCLEDVAVEDMTVVKTNGREWEKQYPEGRGRFD